MTKEAAVRLEKTTAWAVEWSGEIHRRPINPRVAKPKKP